MKIDGNELAILQDKLYQQGRDEEGWKIKQEFLKQVRESGDHCPCQQACPHHGNCFECVTIHRGHRDHLPMCMWDMVNERLHKLSLMTDCKRKASIATARLTVPVKIYDISRIPLLFWFCVCECIFAITYTFRCWIV